MNETVNIKVKLMAEKKERFHGLKNNNLTKRLFNFQKPMDQISNVKINTNPSGAVISWDSTEDTFDILVLGTNYKKAETIKGKSYRLFDLAENENYSFSVRTLNGNWQERQFTTGHNDTVETSGIQHSFTLIGETITDVSEKSKWVFEQTLSFDTKQIAKFQYENNDSEKWHVELILNDRIVAKSNKGKINTNVRIGNYVITPLKTLSLQNRTKMILGSQLTGLMRRAPQPADVVKITIPDEPEPHSKYATDVGGEKDDVVKSYWDSVKQTPLVEEEEPVKKTGLFG